MKLPSPSPLSLELAGEEAARLMVAGTARFIWETGIKPVVRKDDKSMWLEPTDERFVYADTGTSRKEMRSLSRTWRMKSGMSPTVAKVCIVERDGQMIVEIMSR